MADKIEVVGNSIIQHGKENNRIYLMKLCKEDCPGIVNFMDNLALNDGYTKIIAKVQESLKNFFVKEGYVQEAIINNFFEPSEACYFLSKYFSKDRENFSDRNEVLVTTQFCIEKATLSIPLKLDEKFCIKRLGIEHISQMIEIYRSSFQSYPFPIFEGNYLVKTMKENIDYFGVFDGEKLIALASSEMDLDNHNTEMTDFAVLPEYRGSNLSYHLLKFIEICATEMGLKTAYTIARARNTGINMTFAKMFYEFGGTLVNNTNICGGIETMNVWYKILKKL